MRRVLTPPDGRADHHVTDTQAPQRRIRRRPTSDPGVIRLPDAVAERVLAERLGVTFADPLVLRQALTHRSVLQDWLPLPGLEATLQSNERLEFLGDALLGAFVAEHLYRQDPDADEGLLTRRRVAIVRAETLVRWARELDVHSALYLGIGETVTESARDRMLAGAFEALVGAIYLDQGHAAAERFVLGFLVRDGDAIRSNERDANPKGHLQEILQDRAIPAPEYVGLATEGPDHARQFTEAVMVDGRQLGIGTGRSRRAAQQAAARIAIRALEGQGS
jgi:ribonuclease III